MSKNAHKQAFEEVDAVDLMGVPDFTDWIFRFYPSYENFCNIHQLFADNREKFKDSLGKQHFCTEDSSRRRLYVWKVELNNGNLWLLTARERGTSYEVDNTTVEVIEEAKQYLSSLFGFSVVPS